MKREKLLGKDAETSREVTEKTETQEQAEVKAMNEARVIYYFGLLNAPKEDARYKVHSSKRSEPYNGHSL